MKKVVFADLGGMIPFDTDPLADIAETSYFYDLPSAEDFVARCQVPKPSAGAGSTSPTKCWTPCPI